MTRDGPDTGARRAKTVPRWGDRRRARIGLLGGSFNPAHAGHRYIAELALRRLRLDQIWLLVSPGNPLKEQAGMAPLDQRMASARAIARGDPRLLVTDIESLLGTRYTVDTLRALRRAFPRARFVWLMGADNLIQIPRWRRWKQIFHTIPVAVFARAPYSNRALAGLAARRFWRSRVDARHARRLTAKPLPAWVFLHTSLSPESATAIRLAGGRSGMRKLGGTGSGARGLKA